MKEDVETSKPKKYANKVNVGPKINHHQYHITLHKYSSFVFCFIAVY